jgi:hypothetical protein
MTSPTVDPFQALLDSLPDPRRDPKPPAVTISFQDLEQAKEDKAFLDSLLDPKVHTEQRVKYALHALFGMNLRKDGDYNVGGFFTKKNTDFIGSTPADGVNWHTHVEVKGMSPYKNFNLARLDRPNTEGQPSQFDKMDALSKIGDFTLLALGWWTAIPGAKPVYIQQKNRKIQRWKLEDVELEFDLVWWGQFLQVYKSLDRRSVRPKDREKLFPYCRIYKERNRWRLCEDHWWNRIVILENAQLGRASLSILPVV